MSYTEKLRQTMQSKKGYVARLREPKPALVEEPKKPDKGYDADQLKGDVQQLKQEGYSLQEIHEAIDGMGEINDKEGAKKVAGDEFAKSRTHIVIIRHGSTKLNSEGGDDRIRGWKDVPLDSKGEKEAEVAGERLKGRDIDGIVASDLSRTVKTAEIISKITGFPILETTKAFRPWDVGKYTGELSKEVFPILRDLARHKPDEVIPGGESFNQFKERFLTGLDKVKDKYPGKTIAIVTHHRGDRITAASEGTVGGLGNHEVDIDEFLDFPAGVKPGGFRAAFA